ncbi:MAG: GNAT family N-acetyltransferase [Anaerolineales bacterium]|nr:GNAT family N-acetyltransferase [Anaerolineales bacterium]
MVETEAVVGLMPAQVSQAAQVLNKAFEQDPIYTEIIPDQQERLESMLGLWEGLVDYCLAYGQVYTTPKVGGVACWLLPGNVEMTLWRILRRGMRLPRAILRLRPQARQRLRPLLNRMDQERRRLMPGRYWYLLVLGVDPALQGQGIGGKLIAPALQRADAEGVPCYLETQTESNVAFYQRRGFEVMNEDSLPGYSFRIWAMARQARRNG